MKIISNLWFVLKYAFYNTIYSRKISVKNDWTVVRMWRESVRRLDLVKFAYIGVCRTSESIWRKTVNICQLYILLII